MHRRYFVKIRREHAPFCPACWIDSGHPDPEEMRPHGSITGERFWCEVLQELPDGRRVVRVDNRTIYPGSMPRLGDIIMLAADEPILDRIEARNPTRS
jgi:hypothetical protein